VSAGGKRRREEEKEAFRESAKNIMGGERRKAERVIRKRKRNEKGVNIWQGCRLVELMGTVLKV